MSGLTSDATLTSSPEPAAVSGDAAPSSRPINDDQSPRWLDFLIQLSHRIASGVFLLLLVAGFLHFSGSPPMTWPAYLVQAALLSAGLSAMAMMLASGPAIRAEARGLMIVCLILALLSLILVLLGRTNT